MREKSDLSIDEALAESFPASDPPGWNLATARLTPRVAAPDRATGAERAAAEGDTTRGLPDVVDLSRPGRPARTRLQTLTSLAGAAGLALLVPVAILALGLPIALAGRAVIELLAWLIGR